MVSFWAVGQSSMSSQSSWPTASWLTIYADSDGALKKYWKNMKKRYAAGAIPKYGMLCRNGTVFVQGKRYKNMVKAEMSGRLQSIGDDWQELATQLQSELHTNLSRYSQVLVKVRECMRMP